MKTISRALLAGASVLAVAGPVMAMDFYAYEGKPVVKVGERGTRKTVDGVDFWQSGEPAHRYQVLGTLSDSRRSSGLIGMVRMGQLDHDVARQVKAAGGDGVILQGEDEKVTGLVNFGDSTANGSYGGGSWNATGSSFGMVRPRTAHTSSYVVVRYLDDQTAPAAVPIAAAQR